jgi:hypothetical protein
LRRLLLLADNGVTYEFHPGKKQKMLLRMLYPVLKFAIDRLMIQEGAQEVLTLPSGPEYNSIINIKFPMNTALIFKEQAKSRNQD